MKEAEFDYNLDEDARKIADAIADINERIDAFLEEEAQQEDDCQEQEIKWPSLMPKED